MAIFEPSYNQVHGPPVPCKSMYLERVEKQYKALLDRNPSEMEMQHFFELHPVMMPGARTPGLASGHYPLHCALISQPPLHGFNGRIPDFMWLSTHSGSWFPAMIEIEKPGKLIFRNDGEPNADFNHARNQLLQWNVWLNAPENQLQFMKQYGVDNYFHVHREMGRHFILIYGRRSEFSSNPQLSRHRNSLLTDEFELASFDRMTPDPTLINAVTVKAIGNGKFHVISVPETYSLSPVTAGYLSAYVGLEDAIDQNKRISPDRCSFLKDRIAYWREWAKSPGSSIIANFFQE